MISPEQIRAARAMIDWSQEALAEASGLSPTTIHNLEKGKLSHRSTIPVRKALENRGFEFFGTNGLNRRTDESRTYEGINSPEEFFEDMCATVKGSGGEIVAIYKSSEILARSLGVTNSNNLECLERLSKFAKVKCLISDVRNSSLLIPSFQFRAISQHPLGQMATFTCGDKHAIVMTKDGIKFTYFVMRSIDIAQAELNRFSLLWNGAFPLTASAHP